MSQVALHPLTRPRQSSADWPTALDAASAPPIVRKRRRVKSTALRSENLWLWSVDMSLLGVLTIVPFLLGGRHPLGQMVLIGLASTATAAWLGGVAARQLEVSALPRGIAVFAVGALLILAQVTPLSASWLDWLSPTTTEHLPLWNGASESLGRWSTLSLTPSVTLDSLGLWAAYAALFWVATQRIASTEDVGRVSRWLASSATAMALFGLAQHLVGNGSFFWCYEHPYSDASQFVKGAFTNRNHFAHWMALGVGPLVAWLVESLRGESSTSNSTLAAKRFAPYLPAALGVALALVLGAALISLSRGGALAVMAAATVVLATLWRADQLRGAVVAALLGAGALLLAVLLAVNSVDRVASRLDDLGSASAEDLDRLGARQAIWKANLAGLSAFPLLGSGIGSHREVYPLFLEGFGDYEFTHAENGYLQIGLETGVAGLALLAAGLFLVSRWAWMACRRDARTLRAAAPLLAVLAASAVHSLVDFVWYLPALAATVALVAGCLYRLAVPPLTKGGPGGVTPALRSSESPRWRYAIAAVAVAASGLWIVQQGVGPLKAQRAWEQYLLLEEPALVSDEAEELDPAALAQRVQEQQRAEWQQAQQAVALLDACVAADPTNSRARLRLAGALLRRFELAQRQSANAMGVFELRDAVAAARFPNHEALAAWLDRAVGPSWRDLERARWQALTGLQRSPLSGEGYTLLAQVEFLAPQRRLDKSALLAQASQVRPHDGGVLFQRGREELLAGRPQPAMQLWKKSYASGRAHQQRIIDLLAGRLPARVLFEQFEPNLAALRVLRHRCEQANRLDDLKELAPRFAQAAVQETPQLDGVEAARIWVEAHRLFRRTNQLSGAYEAARRAVERDPHGVGPRAALAEDLLALQRFEEAAAAYRWCRSRRPHDERLARGLEAALRGGRG